VFRLAFLERILNALRFPKIVNLTTAFSSKSGLRN